jgi:hypothetical protein
MHVKEETYATCKAPSNKPLDWCSSVTKDFAWLYGEWSVGAEVWPKSEIADGKSDGGTMSGF